jgi:glyoxylate/hydroxypyruvate reductase
MGARPQTIVICSYLEPELVRTIREHAPDANVVSRPELLPVPQHPGDHSGIPRALSEDERACWRAVLGEAEITFDFDWLEPATMPLRCPRLRWTQAASAGIGEFMHRTGLDGCGFTVTTAAGVHGVPLAEFALTGILYFLKDVPGLERRRRAHQWEYATARQLSGARALVVGLGGIGRQVVSSLAGLGVEVWGMGREGRRYDVPGVTRYVDVTDLCGALPLVEAVVLACPLTEETRGLIGKEQLDRMRPDAVLVNVARGQVVDQDALYDALRSGRIGGACLDVFAEEPLPPDDPMWDLDNVVISSHVAAAVETENRALVELFLDNLDRFRRGDRLRNVYDPVAGY